MIVGRPNVAAALPQAAALSFRPNLKGQTLTDISNSNWVAIAQLLRPQGRRGELLAEPLTSLNELFAPGTQVWLSAANATAPRDAASSLTLEEHFFPTGKNAGRIVIKLSGCDSINSAEVLAGQQLLVPATAMPVLDADTFFVGDLLGCTLFDGDQPIGTVVDLQYATAPDGRTRLEDAAPLLAITPISTTPTEDPEPTLIPFVRAWLDNVDLPNKRIQMHLPPGLLDPAE